MNELVDSKYEFVLDDRGIADNVLRYAANIGSIDAIRIVEKQLDMELGISRLMEDIMKHDVSVEKITSNAYERDAVDKWGRGALYYATVNQDEETTAALLEAADTLPVGLLYRLPEQMSDSTLKVLLSQSDLGERVLASTLLSVVKSGSLSKTKILLDAGANPTVRQRGEFHPLFVAASHGEHELSLMLLDYGADPTISLKVSGYPTTPIMAALYSGSGQLVQDMVKKFNQLNPNAVYGTDRNQVMHGSAITLDLMLDTDASGMDDLLMEAARERSYPAVQVLLKHGANIHSKDGDGISARGILISERERLSKRGGYTSGLMIADIDRLLNAAAPSN